MFTAGKLSRSRLLLALAASVIAGGLLLTSPSGWSAVGADTPAASPSGKYVYRVAGDADADKLLSSGFDVLEDRDGSDLFVLGDRSVLDRLRERGFRAYVDSVVPKVSWTPPAKRWQDPQLTAADVDETYYGGYHTINAHLAHLDQVAQQRPDLATVVDYGDSWRKSRGSGGYDLKAICLTKKATGDCARSPNSAKPRFFLMSQVHAREISTGDMSWRWIDHLVNGYGSDTQVTALLDSTEVWVVPIANPDGVEIVQQGGSSPVLHRKNANTSNGSCSGTGVGVDLNRNNSKGWGSGSSGYACDETYRGPQANSEVETQALQRLWRELYPDKRDGSDTTPAPADTRGVAISMHSYANMVLFPWGFNSQVKAGNDASLRGMARDMANLSGYRYGQPGEILYNAGGAHDDWLYGELGVAHFTFEIGASSGSCSGFLPQYSCQQSSHWPTVKPMLLYAARKAANPYGSGTPDPTPSPTASPTPSPTGSCAGTSYTGSLNAGGSAYQPNGSYYQSTSSGTHAACLDGPTGTDFDLYLQKWNGSSWTTVAAGETANPDETISYNGTAGYYRYRVYAYGGSGSYTLTVNRPT
ncbi:MAG: M14 family zinc carboxypeptidase [Micromonosporaceae bacterium]